jgi:DNA-binding response OmpR family regulator
MNQGALVLVADNSASFRIFIEKVIAEVWPRAHLIFCRDGMDVLEYFEDGSGPIPVLVLLDLGPTSFDVLKWLREQRRLDDLPVIIWSSVPLRREKAVAKELRATDYLKKPDTFAELLESVRAFEQGYQVPNC